MKFTVDNDKTGTLIVRKGNSRRKYRVRDLDLDKLYLWYPLNINYTYRYQKSRDRLYLRPVESTMKHPDYNLPTRQRYKPEGIVINNMTPDMMCENVMRDNTELFVTADRLGLPHMLKSDTTLPEIRKAIVKVLDYYESIKNYITDKRILVDDELAQKYRNYNEDNQDKIIFEHTTEEEIGEMKTFGKLYTMLNLMRKIKEKRMEVKV